MGYYYYISEGIAVLHFKGGSHTPRRLEPLSWGNAVLRRKTTCGRPGAHKRRRLPENLPDRTKMLGLKRLITESFHVRASIAASQHTRQQDKLHLLPSQHLAQMASNRFLDIYEVPSFSLHSLNLQFVLKKI